MRSSILITILVLLTLTSVQAQVTSSRATVDEIPTVEFCELLKNPQRYNQKVLRTRAVFSRGGEDWAAIYCPKCSDDKTLVWPEYSDSFEKTTDRAVLRKFKEVDITISVTMIGRFDATQGGHLGCCPYQFHIMRAERAATISKTGLAPWKMSEKDKRRIRSRSICRT